MEKRNILFSSFFFLLLSLKKRVNRERSKAKRFCEMNSHSVVLRRSAWFACPDMRCTINFPFNLGDCETRTKNIKGSGDGGETGKEGCSRKEAVVTDGWHCGAIAHKMSPG